MTQAEVSMTPSELIAAIEARQVRNKSWRGRFGEDSPIVNNEITPMIKLLDQARAAVAELASEVERLRVADKVCCQIEAERDAALRRIEELERGSNYVCDKEVCPTSVQFVNGRVVRLAHDADNGYYLEVERVP